MNIFSPKGFLQIGGALFLLISVLGFVGIFGPTPEQSIFGTWWWFDNAENTAGAVIGAVGILAAFTFPAVWQRYLVLLCGLVAVLVGLYNFISPSLLGANLETPADLTFHLIIGIWALYAVYGNTKKDRG